MPSDPRLIVAFQTDAVADHICHAIADICLEAIAARGAFTIALSGGSLPKFLKSMTDVFEEKGEDPKLDCWHVVLADERCVPSSDDDSNMRALKDHLFSVLKVPESQIHGIDESLLSDSSEAVATDYELTLQNVLAKSGGHLDLAVLGFGPDGHTCSLFPDHALLKEDKKLVASLDDSPKPPPSRITLTFPVLNTMTRHVIFCGAGSSKGPILRTVFKSLDKSTDAYSVPNGGLYKVTVEDPPPYPCGMVKPLDSLTWIVDADAMNDARSAPSPY